MVVFANLSGTSWNPETCKESINHSQGNSTVVVFPHSTPTPPDLNLTATAGTIPVLTPTKAYIKVCSTPADIVQRRLVICGHNFDPAHEAALLAFGKKPMWQSNLPVYQHVTFQFVWNIVNCSNLPTIIYSYEATSSKPTYAKLQITSFGSCPEPTSTPIAGPPGF